MLAVLPVLCTRVSWLPLGVAQAVGPYQPRALRCAVLVGDQLAVDADAQQARCAEGQGFDGELHLPGGRDG